MAKIQEIVADAVNGAIELVSGDTAKICKEAKGSNVQDWSDAQTAKAVAIGAGAAAIPIAGYFTLPADLAATLRLMHRAATGICYIKLGQADDETFAGVLAVWSGAATLDADLAKQIAVKGMATSATLGGGAAGVKLSIKAFGICANTLASKKLGLKVSQKVATKIASKITAKAATRWIPIISAAAGGGANWYIISSFCEAAEKYSDFIIEASEARKKSMPKPNTAKPQDLSGTFRNRPKPI